MYTVIIAPKLGERNSVLSNEIIDAIDSKIEIQMITKDLIASWDNCVTVILNVLKYKGLDEVVLHLPFSLHTFEVYLASEAERSILYSFLHKINWFGKYNGITFGVLFHQESSMELIQTIDPTGSTMLKIFDSVNKFDNLYLLVENCLPCLNCHNTHAIQAFELLQEFEHPKLFGCVDICHIRCHENIYNANVRIPKSIVERVRWIHFSGTLNGDGYRDRLTHGRLHESLQDLCIDLEYLINNQIDLSKVPIVTEISEMDYLKCPKMLEEISLLQIARNSFTIFNQ